MTRLLALALVTTTLPVASPRAHTAHDAALHPLTHTHAADLMEWLYGPTCEDCGLRVGGLFKGGCRCVEFSGRFADAADPLVRPALFAGDAAPRAPAAALTDRPAN